MARQFIVGLAVLAVLASARLLDTRDAVPMGWTRQSRAASHQSVTFVVAMKQQNLDKLDSIFWAVSDPQHPEYQNFMTIDEINAIVSPPAADKQAVREWLGACARIEDFGDAFKATATVQCTETLFNTHLYEFTHSTGARVVRQWGAYSVPSHLGHIIELVEGLGNFPVPHLRKQAVKKASDSPNAGTDAVIAQTLFSLYNVPLPIPYNPNATQSTIQFDQQYFSQDELTSYGNQVDIDVMQIATVVGQNNPSQPGDESQMDVEMMGSVNNGSTTWFWIEPTTSWLYLWSVQFMNTPEVPQITSISYGWSEMNECDINPTECHKLGINSQGYVTRTNNEFQKIGLRGTTIVAASADSGANGRTDLNCTLTYLKPAFPASSPFVTSVGATQLNDQEYNLDDAPELCESGQWGCLSGGTEVAVSFQVAEFASGGGFSVFSAMPSYQKAAVSGYLNSNPPHLPPMTYFNGTNRGYPDVASLGHNCLVLEDSELQAAGGTSCSAPSFAGIVGILNQVSLQNTGKPLGFLNPLLYQMEASNPETFNDITVGDNHCTEDGCKPRCKGFWCTKGWDPVTGLGSANVGNMIAYINNNLKRRS